MRAYSEWFDKDELLDVVFWGKRVLSLIVAITFGVTSMHGILAIHAYVAISTVVVQHFVLKYHQVNEDEVGGFWELARKDLDQLLPRLWFLGSQSIRPSIKIPSYNSIHRRDLERREPPLLL
ncbi:hypothetical protein KIN20_022575, partial [Parelaphostrongylus tenuis]